MEKLIFVYNAQSGKLNALMDSMHKVLSPSTYDCKLCELTFGLLQENKTWREFRDSLDVDTEFLHRDEFQKTYASKFGHKFEYPIILGQTAKGLEVVVSKPELNKIQSTGELIEKLKNRI
ncbi:GTPase [Christiangramia aquimixticola]|uniref:GTPase n=1 Tax=Christiangramia aquimixticola TaxID=1697558 RepID=UPI003AA91FCE